MRKQVLILILVGVLGFLLRIFFLKDGGLTFGFDQARDAYNALEILKGDLKILGPSASTPGLYHGVLYFYLIAPAYFLGNGSPYIAAIWLSIVNILTIVPIYFLGRILFSEKTAILSAILFAFSFDGVQYATWMSNPAPAVLSVAVFYLGLAILVFGKKRMLAIILASLGLGLSVQFEIFLGYLVVPLFLVMRVYGIRPKIKEIGLFILLFILSTGTMILSYLKFGMTFLSGFSELYVGKNDPFGSWREFAPTLDLYLNRFAEYFYRGYLPFNVAVGGIFGIVVVGFFIYWVKKGVGYRRQLLFLLILLFSHGLLIPFGGNSTPFINAGLQAVVAVMIGYFLIHFLEKKWIWPYFLIFIMFASCIHAAIKFNPSGQTVFAIQRGLILKNELAAIDYTYKSANGEKFSINTVTSPLWINTVWSYLYNWYGANTYGYLPSFRGRDQTGRLGVLPVEGGQSKYYYLIIEPLAGIPERFVNDTIAYEDSFSKVMEEVNIGGIVVQKRQLTKPYEEIVFIK